MGNFILNRVRKLKSGVSIIRPIDWAKGALLGLLLSGLYYSTFIWLFKKDWARDDFTYGYLIPFVVLYLIWEKRNEFSHAPISPSWNGLLFFIPGIIFYWLGELSGEFFTLYLSSWFILVGLGWLNLGWQKLKQIRFALLIAPVMFPPPHFINNKITLKLKLISSKLGVAMIQAYGMTASREGNIIDLGFTQLQVVDACSGLRYLLPIIILGILLVYYYKMAFWKKAVVVVSTLPLTILANASRIALTSIFYERWGPKIAEGFFHGFSGWFIFMVSLVFLLFEMLVLKNIGQKSFKIGNIKEKEKDSSLQLQTSGETIKNLKKISCFRSFWQPPQFIVAVILLGTTLALSQGVEFRREIPLNMPFEHFPLQVGEWNGKRESMEQMFIDELDLSDYVIVDYKNDSGKHVNFYTAYYKSQGKGESIHSPETCLPGSGWILNQAGTTQIPVPYNGKDNMLVNRAFIQKSGYRMLAYYWFVQRGRILTNAYQLKIYAFWDAITRQRTDGALVRLITPIYGNEEIADAEKRLQAFMREIVTILNKFIPK